MTSTRNAAIGLAVAAILVSSVLAVQQIPSADATKIRNCTTSIAPKGVDATNMFAWVAIDGPPGKIQRFSLSSCSVTNYTTGITGDPHFIDVTSDTSKVIFTEHSSNKVAYLNPGTNTVVECTNSNLNSPDDIDSWTGTNQYFTSYNNGKLIRSSLSGSTCTFTAYTVPGTGANPEGITRSSDVNGFFVVDNDPINQKLYKFDQSTGTFTLCRTFTAVPWFAAAWDATDRVWVTFSSAQKIKAVSTLNCLELISTVAAGGNVYDVAVAQGGLDAYVTFITSPDVKRYRTSSLTWSPADNWNTECSGCMGFGIDESSLSDNTYYAAMRGSPSKLVVGSIPG